MSARQADSADTLCPIARSTSLVGDRWSVMIVRELLMGVTRFQDLSVQTGATPQLLTARLKALEGNGILQRHAYAERPRRYEYRLTAKGYGFMPVILALRAWGETWCKSPEEGLAVRMSHRACGTELELDGGCPTCGVAVVPLTEMQAAPSAAYAAERSRRTADFAAARRSALKLKEPKP